MPAVRLASAARRMFRHPEMYRMARLQMLKPRLSVSAQGLPTLGRIDATPRERGRRWMRRRAEWFSKRPLCVMCETENRVSAATELDHIVPLWKGGADAEHNLQGLCRDHHQAKTAAEAKDRAGQVPETWRTG